MQSLSNQSESEVWTQIVPLLEEAILRLRQTDRDALVLRFIEGRNLKEVGIALGASEEAAKKRINRAVEKLRAYFFKRGVNSTAATIAGAVSANSVQVAPATLIKTATAVALTRGATASTLTSAVVKGALKIMAWTKAKTAVAAGAVILLTCTTISIVATQAGTSAKPIHQCGMTLRMDTIINGAQIDLRADALHNDYPVCEATRLSARLNSPPLDR